MSCAYAGRDAGDGLSLVYSLRGAQILVENRRAQTSGEQSNSLMIQAHVDTDIRPLAFGISIETP